MSSRARTVDLYDTTLRDGVQREGLSLSLDDKLRVAQRLDRLGVQYIEGGYPGSNARDQEFFTRVAGMSWQSATIVAFGSSRYKDNRADDDPALRALVNAGTSVVTIVCKNSASQVRDVLGVPLSQNLEMIADSVAFLRTHGKRVFYDAEHFFDGFRDDPDYALECLRAAAHSGAETLVLCDTNGGTLPADIGMIVGTVVADFGTRTEIGIHTHDDCGLAVAGALAGFAAGAVHIQGTINGYGERCGNANLCSIIPTLKLKLGVNCVTDQQLQSLTDASRFVASVCNLNHDPHAPYVGASAFAHKAGYHADAMRKNPMSYQHVSPEEVGNVSRILISELSGKAAIASRVEAIGLQLGSPERARTLALQVKELESRGFQFEGAEASFELMARRTDPDYRAPFELVDFLALVESRDGRDMLAEAMVKVRVEGEVIHTAGEGNGPVNALDQAMRKALVSRFPQLTAVRLADYKVRVIDEGAGTAAWTRVTIDSTDGSGSWTTVGSSSNIIEASWFALADSMEYALVRAGAAFAAHTAPVQHA
ncbi:MAG: citramalate synthase [Chloroflexota bacterium]|jgi:2-isopropylmalate synthase|nr:citramalate synthase [Chloroflexota bacterium]